MMRSGTDAFSRYLPLVTMYLRYRSIEHRGESSRNSGAYVCVASGGLVMSYWRSLETRPNGKYGQSISWVPFPPSCRVP